MKNLLSLLAVVAIIGISLPQAEAAMSIAQWSARSGHTYHTRWNSGEVKDIYFVRNHILRNGVLEFIERAYSAEMVAGLKTCEALVAAGVATKACERFSVVR